MLHLVRKPHKAGGGYRRPWPRRQQGTVLYTANQFSAIHTARGNDIHYGGHPTTPITANNHTALGLTTHCQEYTGTTHCYILPIMHWAAHHYRLPIMHWATHCCRQTMPHYGTIPYTITPHYLQPQNAVTIVVVVVEVA